MNAKSWQVWVRYDSKAHKYGDPLPQDKAMKVLEELQKDPRVAEAFLEEEE